MGFATAKENDILTAPGEAHLVAMQSAIAASGLQVMEGKERLALLDHAIQAVIVAQGIRDQEAGEDLAEALAHSVASLLTAQSCLNSAWGAFAATVAMYVGEIMRDQHGFETAGNA